MLLTCSLYLRGTSNSGYLKLNPHSSPQVLCFPASYPYSESLILIVFQSLVLVHVFSSSSSSECLFPNTPSHVVIPPINQMPTKLKYCTSYRYVFRFTTTSTIFAQLLLSNEQLNSTSFLLAHGWKVCLSFTELSNHF